MPDVAYTDERDEQFDFHQQYVAESWSYLYVSGGRAVQDVGDLDGLRIAVLEGSVQEERLARITAGFQVDVTLVPADSLTAAFDLVAEGAADAAVANHFFGDYTAPGYGYDKTPIVFGGSRLYFAVAQGENGDLLNAIDSHLIRWIDEPGSVYYTTLAHHTNVGDEARLLQVVSRVLAGVAVALAATLGLVFFLRWRISVHTRDLQAAQTELERNHEQLESLVADRTAQLEEANKELEKRNRAKGQFLSFLSHEFRNELNTISGFSNLLIMNPGGLSEEQKHQVDFIVESATRLRTLINDVLDLSKTESGAMKPVYAALDVRSLVLDVADTFTATAASSGNDLVSRLPDDPVIIETDEGMVRQILVNLVSNALKFMSEGTITIVVTRQDDGVTIQVRDTGRGVTGEEIEHLFDEFWQSVDVRRDVGIGTGLGLSICMNLARALGGRIEVESTPHEGSTFSLVLPDRPADESGPPRG